MHLGLLKANFILSTCAAAIGILVPFGLCYALLYAGWGFGAVETFIVGAALSVTSLGTTFVVIASAAKGINLPRTRIGTVLIGAAVISDVSGLVMARSVIRYTPSRKFSKLTGCSVIHNIGSAGEGGDTNIGWLVGRPVVASIAMGVLSPLIAKYVASPIFRWYVEDNFAQYKHISNIILMVFVLCGFLSVAGFSGASPIYGAFLAGTFLTSLPCIHPLAPFSVLSREHGETDPDKTPTFVHTFEKYFLDARQYILQPMFFASVGFAIPFRQLWNGEIVWKGFVFALVMLFGKVSHFNLNLEFELRGLACCGVDRPIIRTHHRSPSTQSQQPRQVRLEASNSPRSRHDRSRRDRAVDHPDRSERNNISLRGCLPDRHMGNDLEHHHRPSDCRAATQAPRPHHQ